MKVCTKNRKKARFDAPFNFFFFEVSLKQLKKCWRKKNGCLRFMWMFLKRKCFDINTFQLPLQCNIKNHSVRLFQMDRQKA